MTGVGGLVRTLSLRHITERRLRSALTAGGVAAGVALLCSIGSMNATLSETVHSTATAFDGRADLQVTAGAPGGLVDSLPGSLVTIPGVAKAVPVLQVRSRLHINGETQGVFVFGTTSDIVALAPLGGAQFVVPPDPDPSADGVVLSEPLARRLGVRAGATVEMDAPRGAISQRVVGIVSSPAFNRINGGMVVAMALPAAQRAFDRPGRIDVVLVVARRATPIPQLRAAVAERVGGAGIVTTPGNAPGATNANIEPFVMLTDAVGLISLFVALVLVFNTMSMAMAERRRELSLARALGASPRQLFAAALAEAAVVGILGTVVGLAAGSLLADVLMRAAGDAYRSVLPVDAPTDGLLRASPLILAALAGIAVSVVGAVIPARRALRVAPIDALRPVAPYEWSGPPEMSRARLLATAGAVLLGVGTVLGAAPSSTTPSPALGAVTAVAILSGITLLLPSAVPLAANLAAAVLGRMWGTVGRLAGDALRSNPKRTSLTVATLILPLATVIGLGTAFDSAQTKFGRLARIFISTPIVVNAESFVGYTATQPLPEAAGVALEAVPGVRAVLPDQNTFLNVDGRQAILYVIPLRAAERAGVGDALHDADLSPDPVAFHDGLVHGGVAVSRLAAHRRHLRPGSTLTLPTPAGPHLFAVAAVFDDLAGEDTFYIDRDTYTSLWGDTGAFRFSIVPDPDTPIPALIARLTDTVRAGHLPAQIQTRAEAVRQLESGLTQIFSIARAIQLAALIVGGLSLASTAFTTILERRWTLGLQRTLGMSRRQIARSLVLEAVAVGVLGAIGATVIGLAIGTMLGRAVGARVWSPVPITVPWSLVGICAVTAVAISAAATQYPRRMATRTPIIDSLSFDPL